MKKNDSKKLNNIRLCRDLLNKGLTQREIAKALKISLPTVNKYCKQIALEIEQEVKQEREIVKEEHKQQRQRARRAKVMINEAPADLSISTPEELAKASFSACLNELRLRLPLMSNEEVIKVSVELWDRVNGRG